MKNKLKAHPYGHPFRPPFEKARILFDHPHSYRTWSIVGEGDVPGFFYLESAAPTHCEYPDPCLICLDESQFERVLDDQDYGEKLSDQMELWLKKDGYIHKITKR